LSRDPIEERGGVNIYAMVGNNLADSVDILGMGAMKPSCALDEAHFIPVGWKVDHSIYGAIVYVFSYRLKWDCLCMNCCKVEQYVRGTASINGAPVSVALSGVPLDGTIQMDPIQNVADEKCMFVVGDAPGFKVGLKKGDKVNLKMSFWISVRDACNHDKLVWGKVLDISISGTYPDHLTLTPP
jgi:hypothetical protein